MEFLVEETKDEDALEAVPWAMKELTDLKQALNDCGQSAHNWLLTPEGKAWFEAAGKPALGCDNEALDRAERRIHSGL
jgi:hypothetical protein